MIGLIKAIVTSITEALRAYETKIKNQTTTEVVKEKKQLKKASNITENILMITDNYTHVFTETDLVRYNKLKKKFLKVN